MTPQHEERQIAIKLNERLICDLDELAKNGSINRNHLMLSLVNLWIPVLQEARLPGLFYIANLLRVRDIQPMAPAYEHEFTESRLPEKPLPLKFSEANIMTIDGLASVNHISRHLLLKTMIIVGMEELRELTERGPYLLEEKERNLHKIFSRIMTKGFNAFMAYRK